MMIWAAHFAIDQLATSKVRAEMRAVGGLHHRRARLVAIDDHPRAEEFGAHDRARRQVFRLHDRVPVLQVEVIA